MDVTNCYPKKINRPSGVVCAVRNCKATKRAFPNKTFFGFPSNSSLLFNDWIEKCGLDANNLNKSLKVCEDHFPDEFKLQNRLKQGTVPSLNIGNFLETDELFNVKDPIKIKNVYPSCTQAGSSSMDLTLEEFETFEPPYKKTLTEYSLDEPCCTNCETQTKNCAYYRSQYYAIDREMENLKMVVQQKNMKIRSLSLKNRYLRKTNKFIKLAHNTNIKDKINNLSYVEEHVKELGKMLLVRKCKTSKWSQPQRFLAQNIFFRSATTYRYLKNILKCRLPAVSSLQSWMPVKHLKPGVNEGIFNNLKTKIN